MEVGCDPPMGTFPPQKTAGSIKQLDKYAQI